MRGMRVLGCAVSYYWLLFTVVGDVRPENDITPAEAGADAEFRLT